MPRNSFPLFSIALLLRSPAQEPYQTWQVLPLLARTIGSADLRELLRIVARSDVFLLLQTLHKTLTEERIERMS